MGIDDRGPREAAFAALSSVVAAAPIVAPYREVEPILDAMIGLAQTPAHLQQVFVDASNRGHFELGLRALMAIEPSKRTESNIAAIYSRAARSTPRSPPSTKRSRPNRTRLSCACAEQSRLYR